MDIGIGLDATLGLTLEQQEELSQEAASLGYTSICLLYTSPSPRDS